MGISRNRAVRRRSGTPSAGSSNANDAREAAPLNGTVLVVEDDEDVLRLVSTILLGRGLEVRVARNGRTALQSIRERRPDVILLDVMMPGMDGLQVLDHVKGDPHTASIPVILVTAKAEDDDLIAGYRTGAEYYVTKPFTAKQLLYALSLVLTGEAP
jgi:CheY-like chemotaxis protein